MITNQEIEGAVARISVSNLNNEHSGELANLIATAEATPTIKSVSFEKRVKVDMKVHEKEINCAKLLQEASSMIERLIATGSMCGVVKNDGKLKNNEFDVFNESTFAIRHT